MIMIMIMIMIITEMTKLGKLDSASSPLRSGL